MNSFAVCCWLFCLWNCCWLTSAYEDRIEANSSTLSPIMGHLTFGDLSDIAIIDESMMGRPRVPVIPVIFPDRRNETWPVGYNESERTDEHNNNLTISNNVSELIDPGLSEKDQNLTLSKNVSDLVDSGLAEKDENLTLSKNVSELIDPGLSEKDENFTLSKNVSELIDPNEFDSDANLTLSKNVSELTDPNQFDPDANLTLSKNVSELVDPGLPDKDQNLTKSEDVSGLINPGLSDKNLTLSKNVSGLIDLGLTDKDENLTLSRSVTDLIDPGSVDTDPEMNMTLSKNITELIDVPKEVTTEEDALSGLSNLTLSSNFSDVIHKDPSMVNSEPPIGVDQNLTTSLSPEDPKAVETTTMVRSELGSGPEENIIIRKNLEDLAREEKRGLVTLCMTLDENTPHWSTQLENSFSKCISESLLDYLANWTKPHSEEEDSEMAQPSDVFFVSGSPHDSSNSRCITFYVRNPMKLGDFHVFPSSMVVKSLERRKTYHELKVIVNDIYDGPRHDPSSPTSSTPKSPNDIASPLMKGGIFDHYDPLVVALVATTAGSLVVVIIVIFCWIRSKKKYREPQEGYNIGQDLLKDVHMTSATFEGHDLMSAEHILQQENDQHNGGQRKLVVNSATNETWVVPFAQVDEPTNRKVPQDTRL